MQTDGRAVGVGSRCWRCGDRDTTMLLVLTDEGYSDSLQRALCSRCGGTIRAWLEERREEMPGPVKDERRLCEDRVPSSEIDLDELMADGRVIGTLPKAPSFTESRTDRRPSGETSSHDDSSSPPVASKLSEEWRWSGLE